jgi:hypothetical protein
MFQLSPMPVVTKAMSNMEGVDNEYWVCWMYWHGFTSVQDAAKVCQQYIQRDPDPLYFTVVALTAAWSSL